MGDGLRAADAVLPSRGMQVIFRIAVLHVVFLVDVALWTAFKFYANATWPTAAVYGYARVCFNFFTLMFCLRWGKMNRHIQAEGLASAYAVMSTPAFRQPLLQRNKQNDEDTPEVKAYKARRKAEYWKFLFLGFAFFINSCLACMLSVQCVGVTNWIEAVCLLTALVTMAIEFYVLKLACDTLTKEKGHLINSLHGHKIYFWPKLNFHTCDICRLRIPSKGYRCKRCDFDVCERCFSSFIQSSTERRDSVRIESATSSWTYYRRFFFKRSDGWYFAFTFVCIVLFAGAKIGLPNYQGRIIDAVFQKDLPDFQRCVIFLAVNSAIMVVFGAMRDACISIVGRKVAARVRNELFKSMIEQNIPFFDSTMTGNLSASLTNDVNAMVSPWKTVYTGVISNAVVICGGMVMCFVTSWRLSVLSFTCIMPMSYLIALYSKWSTNINREIWSGISDANGIATEALNNIRAVQAFNMQENETNRFITATDNALAKGIKDAIVTSWTSGISQQLNTAGTVLILGVGGYQAIHDKGGVSTADLITFQLYWQMVHTAYNELCNTANEVARGNAAALRVFSLYQELESKKVEVIMPQEGHPRMSNIDVKINNVSFAYPGNKRKALNKINLHLKHGTVTSLVGRSGSGKSTLMQLIVGFYSPQEGEILINDTSIKNIDIISLRKSIAVVSHQTGLVATTITENITYGLEPEEYTAEEVIRAAKKAHAHHFIMDLEHGYQSCVGERGVRLSAGEQQRIQIARAFLRKPNLYILDEATANLDVLAQRAIIKVLHQQQATILVIAHSRETVENSDYIYVLDKGTIVAEGKHGELSQNSTLYHDMFDD
uniref:Uncharacterized protein n=1 Tax=Mucochytrium quahogii TaxID=96639 RepID=A0A7S2SPI8_9STRA|mmetsp:Transcript_8317/g.18153  ORF Transcript_8317/g.18153 Transcript_8317/m.18153 type:complete len:831 (+) Transcript_8317:127-2619(+)